VRLVESSVRRVTDREPLGAGGVMVISVSTFSVTSPSWAAAEVVTDGDQIGKINTRMARTARRRWTCSDGCIFPPVVSVGDSGRSRPRVAGASCAAARVTSSELVWLAFTSTTPRPAPEVRRVLSRAGDGGCRGQIAIAWSATRLWVYSVLRFCSFGVC